MFDSRDMLDIKKRQEVVMIRQNKKERKKERKKESCNEKRKTDII